MRLTFLLMLIGLLQVNASVYSQNEVFSFHENGSTMRDVFKKIEKESKFRFFYNDVLTNVDKKVDLVASNEKIDQVLNTLLEGTNLSYKVLENNLIIISPKVLLQQRTVKGKVTDVSNGEPVIGATVTIQGTTKGVITDANGNYTIDVPSQNSVLVFSFLGYLTEKITAGAQSTIDVKLSPNIKKLQEVVVIGYGTVKKTDLTGAIAQVKGSDLANSTATSVDNLLQGKTSGLQVISSSGEPGSQASIIIRGMNSMNGNGSQNAPLVVVDGIPIGTAGDLTTINPNDIESVNVLKDASATAIYGSQGANGVIMITTKKGRVNQNNIDVNVSESFSTLPKPFDIISDPYLYAELNNEAADNSLAVTGVAATKYYTGGYHFGTYYPSLLQIKSGAWKYKTYWPDVIYRTGKTQNYNVAARGGTEKTQYVVSLGYLNTDGIAIGNHYEKYTGDFKLNQKIWDNLTVGIDSKLEVDNATHSGAPGNEGRSPVFPVRDTTGNFMEVGMQDWYNPAAIVAKILNTSSDYNAITTGYFDWKITPSLTLHSDLSYNIWSKTSDYYEPSDYGTTGFLYGGYGSQEHFRVSKLINDNFLTFHKTFAEKHTITLMGGTYYEKDINTHQKLEGEGFPNNDLTDQNFPSATTKLINNLLTPDDVYGVRTLNSYFGRAVYNFADRYLVTATIRADGASVFGTNNRWGYFPSTALRWNVDRESFFPKNTVITGLDFRFGWGITGSQSQLAPYAGADRLGTGTYWNGTSWVSGYGPGLFYYGDAQSNNYYIGLANKNLKWQSTKQTNIGTDISILNDRIHVTADYYDKETSNLLYLTQVAPSSGFDFQNQNIASTSNKGYEISLDAHIIKSDNLTWDFGANISHNQNKVTALAGNNPAPVPFGALVDQYRGYANYLIVGQPIGVFWGYKTNGIIQTKAQGQALGLKGGMALPGEIAYVGYDNGADTFKTVLGSPQPKFTYGIYTKVGYKGFDLSVSGQGYYGNKVANLQKFNQGTTQYQRWTPDNHSNKYPSLVTGRTIAFSDFYLEDGSFFKIQNAQLGYTFNLKKTPWVKKLRVYVSCDNIYTFTKFSGYDPEPQPGTINGTTETGTNGLNNGGYPRPRTFTGGLNLTF